MNTYEGSCYCGAVKFTLKGDPLFTQYCHCHKCREIAALSQRPEDHQPYEFTAAYLRSNFEITQGEDQLEVVTRNSSNLMLCRHCQSLIYGISQDPNLQAGIGIKIANIHFADGKLPAAFKPDKHIWYQDRVVDVDDSLPKYRDAPTEQMGTGELM